MRCTVHFTSSKLPVYICCCFTSQVRDFITAQGSSLQDELRVLAAAAPQLSLQDCQQLEQQANELGRQLLALEAYMQLNQAGFVKICKKHDKVSLSDSSRQQGALCTHFVGIHFAHSHPQKGHEHKAKQLSAGALHSDTYVCATV
jgi:hypothetical protein